MSYEKNALTGHIAEGNHDYVAGVQAKFGQDNVGGFPIFARIVILDVIWDPSVIDPAKLSYWEHELKVANIKAASVAPRNSIIGRRVLGNGANASEKVMVFYPFFPPHVALPAKPGEHVWALFENPDAKVTEIGYWICRIVDPNFVEDVNYTHANRQFDKSFAPGTIAQAEGTEDPKYEYPNGVVDEKDGHRYIVANTATIPEGDDAYEKLLKESDASKVMKYEAVPRYRKRPGDLAFEGSNNTLIVFGTDRTGASAEYDDDPDKGKKPKAVKDDNPDETGTGVIDIVAGRGQTKDTGGNAVKNKLDKKELGKSKKDLAEKEGDPDFKTDRSRILVAMKTKPDKNFKIDKAVSKHASQKPIKDADKGGGAIVVKTDKLRLIARQDVVILVTGAKDSDKDDNGNIKDPDVDPDKCASIIVRSNGDIIFTPAKEGVVKLGGDDADKAVLCFKEGAANAGGTVAAPPMMSTMGGFLGAGGAHGVYATKIMVK